MLKKLTFKENRSVRLTGNKQPKPGDSSKSFPLLVKVFIAIIGFLFAIVGYYSYTISKTWDNRDNVEQSSNLLNDNSKHNGELIKATPSIGNWKNPVILDGSHTNEENNNHGNENDISVNAWPTTNDKCDAIFGNGFTNEIVSCESSLNNDKFDFKCFQNPNTKAIYCISHNLIVDSSMIKVSKGGEPIGDVVNRRESDEFPVYTLSENDLKAAFHGGCNPQGNVPPKAQVSFYIHDVISHIRDVTSKDVFIKDYSNKYNEYCDASVSNTINNNKIGIFILTMRYEYANLYHTSTDWFNVFQMIRTLGLKKNEFELIFLDGHSQGSLDNAWNTAYSDYHFVKQINSKNNDKPLCLKKAIFAPVGYMGGVALNSMRGSDCKKENKYVTEFAQWFVTNFGFEFNKSQRREKIIQISIICRKDYMAHPRNAAKRVARKFGSDDKVVEVAKSGVASLINNGYTINIEKVYLEDMTMSQQISKISSTDVLIGVHGAGMTHVLFLPLHSSVIEIVPNGYDGRIHFQYMSSWRGHHYAKVGASGGENNVQPNDSPFASAVKTAVEQLR